MTDTFLPPEKKFEEIKNNYEILIRKIVLELESNKEEQNKLRDELQIILEDNKSLITSDESNVDIKATSGHEKLTDDAISNLKLQINHLKEERNTIKLLWQTSQETIANLETEIQNYRNELFKPSAFTEIKEKYCKAIRALEDIIKNQKSQISRQADIIRSLSNDKDRALEHIKELEAIILEKDNKLSEVLQVENINLSLREKLRNAMKHNTELEVSTTLAKAMIDERFVREKNALEKLQEALLIAETAVSEKEEALKREIVVKEECESLATTIGQVMEEAARKVEENVDSMKSQFHEKEAAFLACHKEMVTELENQVRATQSAEERCLQLEQRLKEVLKENTRLDRDLQIASEAIADMELKLETAERFIKEDKKSDKVSEEREQQIKQYIESNQQLKERWKSTIEDVTQRFGAEIERLVKENASLKAEIESQRLKANKICF